VIITRENLIKKPMKLKPHTVILGAGASKQAFLNGDEKGSEVPLMPDLIRVLELEDLFSKHNIKYKDKDFEKIYSLISKSNPQSEILHEIDTKVHTYFSKLKLPSKPTLYDHLLLSLRGKDFVATFNWDPFLYDSYVRNLNKYPLPRIIHLHGNVRLGYCLKHSIMGDYGTFCPDCDELLTPSKLIYPTQKNYDEDEFISLEWNLLEYALNHSFTITIFGFNASDTDREAYNRLLYYWKKSNLDSREFESIEIIDKKDELDIYEQWKDFLPTGHLLYKKDFYDTIIPNHPRRSCEALYHPKIYGRIVEKNPIPKECSFESLYKWLRPLYASELKLYQKK
jgi:hypothetical protein